MASGPITSWQTDGETMETVTDFIFLGSRITVDFFLGSKITVDGDCSHEIKRCFLLGRKAMTNLVVVQSLSHVQLFENPWTSARILNLDSILKSRDITLPTKVCMVKAMVFPVVIYGCKSWTIKKAKHQRIDAFELWCWRRLLRVPWTARRSKSQS